jgi:ATP-dependent DNA helicase RecQ
LGLAKADEILFELLRNWRMDEASRQNKPPYVIFHDATLRDIAVLHPQSFNDLSAINGIGEAKLERYGAAVLEIVAKKDER